MVRHAHIASGINYGLDNAVESMGIIYNKSSQLIPYDQTAPITNRSIIMIVAESQ